MNSDALVVGVIAIAILPFILWIILRVISRGVDVRSTLNALRAFGWLNGLATTVLGIAACLSEKYRSLLPLTAACLIGEIGWYLAVRFVRQQWPTIEGRVESVALDGSVSTVTYSFELGHECFGGETTMHARWIPYAAGQRVKIGYNPANPDESTLLAKVPL